MGSFAVAEEGTGAGDEVDLGNIGGGEEGIAGECGVEVSLFVSSDEAEPLAFRGEDVDFFADRYFVQVFEGSGIVCVDYSSTDLARHDAVLIPTDVVTVARRDIHVAFLINTYSLHVGEEVDGRDVDVEWSGRTYRYLHGVVEGAA